MNDLYFHNYQFDVDNISENFYEDIYINNQTPEKQRYTSIDLNKYFENKKGIFFAEIVGIGQNNYHSSK